MYSGVRGGEHDDRDGAGRPQPLADLEPVQPRQHDVEHDEIDRMRAELPQRLLAVGCLDDGEAVALEWKREHLPNGIFVVDEQNRGGGFGHVLTTNHARARSAAGTARIALQWRRLVIPHAVVARAAARWNGPSTRGSTAARSCSSRCRC